MGSDGRPTRGAIDPQREHVPRRIRFFYGAGSIAEGTKNTAFNVFLLFYYNQVLGLSGTLCGTAIFLALCVDAITDPLVGSASDHLHSRFGRRHPFMYASALPMAITFYLLFNPPAFGETGLFLWLTGFAVLVRSSMTLYAIPSSSMVAELTPNYDERTTLVSYRFLFGWLGGLAVSQLGYLWFFAPSATFDDGRFDASAYGGFAAACAFIIAAAILTCAAGTHAVIPKLKPPPASRFTLATFAIDLREVLRNRSFRMLIVAALFAASAAGFNDVVGLYVNTFFWEFSAAQLAILIWGALLGLAVAIAGVRPLTQRYDKKTAAFWMAAVAVGAGPLPIFLRLLGLMPSNDHPALLPIIFAHGVIIVSLVVAIGIVVGSMIADLVDENELATHKRQEGMFASTIAFTTKATSGIGGLLAGVALDLIAFPRQVESAVIDPEKVFALGLAVGPGLMALYLAMLVFLARYELTRERHGEILAELERRRVSPSGAPGA
jgi:GPH family glycoside/pentoside/hexuronide:cation symporter